ncbi:MAG: hypothetical protein U9N56_04190 [Actinomycetota bacterium]|nr:hypothetical protein [Actinomycetota bacterium]
MTISPDTRRLPPGVWLGAAGVVALLLALSSRYAFVLLQPALLSIALAIPAGVGLWWLARNEEGRRWRPIAITYGILFLVFLLTGGKAYYVAPMYSALLAAGSLWFERLSRLGRGG